MAIWDRLMSLNNQRIQAVPNFFIIFYNVGVRGKRKIYGAFAETKIFITFFNV